MVNHLRHLKRRFLVGWQTALDNVQAQAREALAGFRRWNGALAAGLAARRAFLNLPDSTNHFEPLTPVTLDTERFGRYESELLGGLQHPLVRNIALTGDYGAGKSSVIRSFVERHPEYSYAFVSLAAFGKEVGVVDSGAERADIAEQQSMAEADAAPDLLGRIEETIVQQLLYAVAARKLPKSRLKRIVHASRFNLLLKTLGYLAVALAGLRLYLPNAKPETALVTMTPQWLREVVILVPEVMAVCALLGALCYLMFGVVRLLSLVNIEGFALKGGKLETTHHGSVLHRHVDEIVYCFERSTIDVVVIEDLDRFGIHDVFTRLREINFIIKQSPQVKRPVHFIYALRDEMFEAGEKTKFFDLIVPVIPVINSENSREKMIELLKRRTLNGKSLDCELCDDLIETVCYYVDDMRLVKNIVNEFDMYSSALTGKLSLDLNKLFAVVVIRNLHPRAYADLVKRRGVIHDVMQGFPAWRDRRQAEVRGAIPRLQGLRDKKAGEVARSIGELRACVWFELLEAVGVDAATRVHAGKFECSALQFLSDEGFNGIFATHESVHTSVPYDYEQQESPYSVDNLDFLSSISYEARAAVIQQQLDALDSDIAKLQDEAATIARMSFRAGAKAEYAALIREQLSGHDVVSYLMRAGHFDTDYMDYFGYFYEGSLTPQDKNLFLMLRRGELPDVSRTVSNPGMLLSKLDSDDLDEGRGVLTALIDHLVGEHHEGYDPHRQAGKLGFILRAGSASHLERLSVVALELVSSPKSQAFIRAVFNLTPGLFRQLFEGDGLFQSGAPRQQLVHAIVDALSSAQLAELSGDEGHDVYPVIEALEDVSLLMSGLEQSRGGWGWLREQQIAFGHLGDNITLVDLKKLIEWRCIKVSYDMLLLICSKAETTLPDVRKGEVTNKTVSYRRLRDLNIADLNELLFSDTEWFVEVLVSQATSIDEDTPSLSRLLNGLGESPALADQLLEMTSCMLEQLEHVPARLWSSLLARDRVSRTSSTVRSFFDSFAGNGTPEQQQVLSEYVERHASELAAGLWRGNSSDHKLLKTLLKSTAASNSALELLLRDFVVKDASLLMTPMPEERLDMLVASNSLAFTPEIRAMVARRGAVLEGQYLAQCWPEARGQVSTLELESVFVLSKSTAPTLQEKIKMWAVALNGAYKELDGLPSEILRVCVAARKERVAIPKELVDGLKKLKSSSHLTTDELRKLRFLLNTSATNRAAAP